MQEPLEVFRFRYKQPEQTRLTDVLQVFLDVTAVTSFAKGILVAIHLYACSSRVAGRHAFGFTSACTRTHMTAVLFKSILKLAPP